MISNDGHYWATGIILRYGYAGNGQSGWGGTVTFLDNGFASDDADAGQISTQGELRTRYMVRDGQTHTALSVVIDTLIADAARLGIVWRDPVLYYKTDGEDADNPPPDGWKAMLTAEAKRLPGWRSAYVRLPSPETL